MKGLTLWLLYGSSRNHTFANVLIFTTQTRGISGRSVVGLARLSLMLGLVSLLTLVGCASLSDSGGDQQSNTQDSIDSAAVTEPEFENSDANGSESNEVVNSADHTQSGTDKAATINENVASLPPAPEIGARAPDFELTPQTVKFIGVQIEALHGSKT